MAAKKSAITKRLRYHNDGSLWAKGQLKNDVQCGEWTTCDAKGKVYKVTLIKPKGGKAARGKR